jgi:hypothetical protein
MGSVPVVEKGLAEQGQKPMCEKEYDNDHDKNVLY